VLKVRGWFSAEVDCLDGNDQSLAASCQVGAPKLVLVAAMYISPEL